MRKITNIIVALGLCSSIAGCASVGSAMGTNNAETGEAWWSRNVGLGPWVFSSKVFYCPAPANGPAQCKEAKMVDSTAGK